MTKLEFVQHGSLILLEKNGFVTEPDLDYLRSLADMVEIKVPKEQYSYPYAPVFKEDGGSGVKP
jgi:hypothetical protein